MHQGGPTKPKEPHIPRMPQLVPNTNSYHQLWILIPRLQLIAQVQNQDIVLDPMDIDILVLDLSFDFDELNRALKDRRQSERDTIKKPSSRTRELHRPIMDIGRYKESKWTAESTTGEIEPELLNAKKTMKHHSSMIED
ncbi:hypothetical protein JHK86_009631 [Glycine max]|nr:hypothetical protein JHK86_009631 [Glycine max]